MINIDLSKTPSLRILWCFLAVIPGLFFLVSVALGNPAIPETVIREVGHVYPVPLYVALFLSVGSALVIGQAFVLSSWILEAFVTVLILLPKAVFRKVFGANWLYRWWGRHQVLPPKKTGWFVRALRKLNMAARATDANPADTRAVRACLGMAAEKLLERRYGINRDSADGPNGEWGIWFSVLGKPLPQFREMLNVARIILASGLAGFCALEIARNLQQRYFIAMCTVFTFCGLWTPIYHFLQMRIPINVEIVNLRAVLLELQEIPTESKTAKNAADITTTV